MVSPWFEGWVLAQVVAIAGHPVGGMVAVILRVDPENASHRSALQLAADTRELSGNRGLSQ
jgi:hypothetical protein